MKVLIASLNKEKFPDPVLPLGAAYIAHSVKIAGHDVRIFDACFIENPTNELKSVLKEFQPEVIGISIRNVDNNAFPIAENYLDYYKKIVNVCKKNSKAKIIIGGSAFSIFPHLFMNELEVDYGIEGEGEYAFVELLDKIKNNENIKEKIIFSPRIKDINFETYPTREGFDIDKYYKYSGCINIQTKRGCAFTCSYCTYPLLEGHKYRLRSASNIVNEIQFWKENKGIDYIFFVDSVFNYPENFAQEICEEIIKRNLKIKWTGFFIPKFRDPDFVDACIESGVTSMDFGTDAFSPETLKGFDKHFTVDDIFEACSICKDKKIKYNHSLIFGGPNETFDTLEQTITNVELTDPTSVIGFIGVRLYSKTPIVESLEDLDIDIGIDPVFYISEHVKDGIIDYLRKRIKNNNNWIIPGLEKGTNTKILDRMRKKGVKGPLWELMKNF